VRVVTCSGALFRRSWRRKSARHRCGCRALAPGGAWLFA